MAQQKQSSCDGLSAAQNKQTLPIKDPRTQSSKMMELWDYCNSLDFVFLFYFTQYPSPRTESLYLFFT